MAGARDVDEAEGFCGVLCGGFGDGFCGGFGAWVARGCADAGGAIPVVEAAEEATPLVGAGGAVGGERVVVLDEFWEATLWLLDLRVEPTNLRKRWFMEDMET